MVLLELTQAKNKQEDMGVATGDELEKLQRSDHDVLIRVETKMDSLTTELRTSNVNAATQLTDHETRIRVLEKSDEMKIGDQTGAIRTRNFVITIISILLTVISIYILYLSGRK